MNIHESDAWRPRDGAETPKEALAQRAVREETKPASFWSRRRWMVGTGLAGAGVAVGGGLAVWSNWNASDEEVLQRGRVSPAPTWPAAVTRDPRFVGDRATTDRIAAARYTNFFEFSRYKSGWRYVDRFRPLPWTLTVGGLCRQPLRLDFDELIKRYASAFTERLYRHRCVERWAMAVPWTGFPLAELLSDCDPLASATHVKFVSFSRPEEAPHQNASRGKYPWPYVEGLTVAEAENELPLLATGMYGEPLLKQHGAPLRLVVPWKYGYKSIKSIERIELVDAEPRTFWSSLNPEAYPFESNVDPDIPVPWPQHSERMLGSQEQFPTRKFNGYEEWVARLY
jgi:sulfoxide reductase catalytic subunit YedY